MAKEYISFLIDPQDKAAMERIAQHNTPIGEEVNVSLVYREAVRQFLAGYGAGMPAECYPVAEPV